MLPSGKFPRFAITAAVLVAALLLVNLAVLQTPEKSRFRANCLDFSMVLLATISSIYVVRRSSGNVRQLWVLLAFALGLETAAQLISTYYQTFVPQSSQFLWPSDVLFFLWPAPIVMMFLPYWEEEPKKIDWLRLLDFAQIAIVAATTYLYFFYVPALWKFQGVQLVREMLGVYIARDILLFVAFLFLTRSTPSRHSRSFFTSMTIMLLIAAIADTVQLFTLKSLASGSDLADVFWVFPYLFIVFFASTRDYKEPELLATRISPLGDIVVTHILPVAIPLLVILMGRSIAEEQLFIAWLAVTASFVCSAVRLILTNRRQRRIADDLLNAEKALRSSEQMISTAVRSSPDSFSINYFADGPYIEANDGFTRLTGYSRDEILGKSPSQMHLWVNPAERARVLAPLTQTGQVRDIEMQFRTKSGQIRVGLMSASLIEVDGRLCSLVLVRDITARKEAEEIVRTSEERFRSLVENLHVGIMTYDADARILFANRAVLEILDIPFDSIAGQTASELGLEPLRPDGSPIPDSLRPVPLAISTRAPIRGQLIGWRVPDHSDIVWTILDVVPEFSPTGQIVRVVASYSDVTEQRMALEALRESEERFRTLVRDLHVAVVLQDTEGRIQFANAAAYRMFHVPEGTASGKFPTDFGVLPLTEDGKDIPPEEWPLRKVLRTGLPVENGVLGLRRPASADILWAFGNVVPQLDSHGKVIRVISTFADITDMKNAERAIHSLSSRLLTLQDEERRRIGRELHDSLAQTALAINLSLAQARQSLVSTEGAAARALEKARSLTQQMTSEIRTLSYLLHPPLLDDLGLVSALKEYAQGFSDRSGIDTQVQVLSQFNRLPQAAETALFRIVQESLANIQRHSGSPNARILLRQDDSIVSLEIVDSGRGMNVAPKGSPESQKPRLGVGIPGMRERLNLLGGRLELLSGPGGTTVRATLPLAKLVSSETDHASLANPHRG